MNNDTSFNITQESNPVQTVAPSNNEYPSNSIQHQQVMLMQYAKATRQPNPTYFIDDGYSGVAYYRPVFQKILSEIETSNVGRSYQSGKLRMQNAETLRIHNTG